MVDHFPNLSFTGAKVLISGSGNVAQYAALKVIELGGSVLSLSDSKGALVSKDPKGFTPADIAHIAHIKIARGYLPEFHAANESKFEWHEGQFLVLFWYLAYWTTCR
jgi:glutamate dehydrogenase (NADP+)